MIHKLIEGSAADAEVLRSLAAQGDDFSVARDVVFLLRAPSQKQAKEVAGFFNDHRYGRARSLQGETGHRVRVVIHMPITHDVILSVSGFMTCVAALYGLEFDGWGCVAQVRS